MILHLVTISLDLSLSFTISFDLSLSLRPCLLTIYCVILRYICDQI
jgi:hypothetical protein